MRIVVLFIVFAFATIISNAQVEKYKVDNTIDYINSTLTRTLLNQSVSLPQYQKKKANFEKIQSDLKCNIEQPLSFIDLEVLLNKNEFSNTYSDFSKVINQFKQESFKSVTSEDFPKVIVGKVYESNNLKSFFKDYSDLNAKRTELEKTILHYVNPVPTKSEVNPNSDSDNRISYLEETVNSKSFLIFNSNTILIIILFFFTAISLFRIGNRITRHRKDIESLKNSISIGKQDMYQNNSASNFDNKKFHQLVEDFKGLKEEITKLRSINALEERPKEVIFEIPVQKPIPTCQYYTYSEGINYFPIDKAQNNRENTSIYKITPDNSGLTAAFEILYDNDSIVPVADYPERYLDSFCTLKTVRPNQVNRIITEEKGILNKEGNKWILSKKAIIRYE